MLKHLDIPKAALLLFLLVFCHSAFAVQIETTESRYETGGVRHFFVVSSWTAGEGRFCNDMSAVTCNLYLAGAKRPGEYQGLILGTDYWRVKPTTSMDTVFSQMTGFAIPHRGSIFVPKGTQTTSEFCISFAQGYSYSNMGGIIAPVGPCVKVKTPALQCDITGNTSINHRDVFDDAINGNEATTRLQLTCTGISQAVATAAKEDALGVKLRSDGSLYSVLTINGQPAAAGVKIKVGESLPANINLKSTLSQKKAVAPGEFSGSTVLTISLP